MSEPKRRREVYYNRTNQKFFHSLQYKTNKATCDDASGMSLALINEIDELLITLKALPFRRNFRHNACSLRSQKRENHEKDFL